LKIKIQCKSVHILASKPASNVLVLDLEGQVLDLDFDSRDLDYISVQKHS